MNRFIEMLQCAILIAGYQCEIAKHDQRRGMQCDIGARRIRGAAVSARVPPFDISGLEARRA